MFNCTLCVVCNGQAFYLEGEVPPTYCSFDCAEVRGESGWGTSASSAAWGVPVSEVR